MWACCGIRGGLSEQHVDDEFIRNLCSWGSMLATEYVGFRASTSIIQLWANMSLAVLSVGRNES